MENYYKEVKEKTAIDLFEKGKKEIPATIGDGTGAVRIHMYVCYHGGCVELAAKVNELPEGFDIALVKGYAEQTIYSALEWAKIIKGYKHNLLGDDAHGESYYSLIAPVDWTGK